MQFHRFENYGLFTWHHFSTKHGKLPIQKWTMVFENNTLSSRHTAWFSAVPDERLASWNNHGDFWFATIVSRCRSFIWDSRKSCSVSRALLSLCKLRKHEFVKTVRSCAYILRVQSIGIWHNRCVVFLYKVTLPSTGLACIMQHF